MKPRTTGRRNEFLHTLKRIIEEQKSVCVIAGDPDKIVEDLKKIDCYSEYSKIPKGNGYIFQQIINPNFYRIVSKEKSNWKETFEKRIKSRKLRFLVFKLRIKYLRIKRKVKNAKRR